MWEKIVKVTLAVYNFVYICTEHVTLFRSGDGIVRNLAEFEDLKLSSIQYYFTSRATEVKEGSFGA